MARLSPTPKTVKRLFSLSGNKCAFPACPNKLVDKKGNVIGQICHIEAAEKDGERFNSKQTDEQRRAFENLILLCANHHIVTNDVNTYTVTAMQKMKADHEKKFLNNETTVSDETVTKAIEIYNNSYTQANINSGAGTQFNNQAGNQTINYNTFQNEKEELTIIEELFTFVISKIKEDSGITSSKEHLNLSDKIKLNFRSDAEQKEVTEYVKLALLKIELIEKQFQLFSPEQQNDIQSHILGQYNNFKRDLSSNIEILNKLFDEFTPNNKKQNSTYINLAKALVLFFFDDCTIFEKTKTEIGKQQNLFE
jgi:hypothetical protein